MEDYKGIYYNDDEEQSYYEGGAHFKYSELYKILEELSKKLNSKKIPKILKKVRLNFLISIFQNNNANNKTRNVKNNISQSKTNNDSNFTHNNDINIYLNKYIFNKKKTRNRNNNIFLPKKTFNLSSQKFDINKSINAINNTYLINNSKYTKNLCLKSRNKIPSIFKARPNTILNKNKKNNINKENKKICYSKDIKNISNKLKNKKRNYSMIGYSNIININLNHNLTDRENFMNKKELNINNKSPTGLSYKSKNNNVLSGIYINLSNLDISSKKELNSDRNNKHNNNKNNYIRIISKNIFNCNHTGAFLRNNAFQRAKLSYISSHSVSKSKSNIKSNKKKSNIIMNNKNAQPKRNKSNFSNIIKTTLMDDLSKLKKIKKKQKNIIVYNYKKGNKLIYNSNVKIITKKKIDKNNKNLNTKFKNDIIFNDKDEIPGTMTSRTRNLKTSNIFFKTNSIDVEKNKIELNTNKENYTMNKKINSNIINISNQLIKHQYINKNYAILKNKKSPEKYSNKYRKKIEIKNNSEKNLNDNNIIMLSELKRKNKKYSKNK